MSWLEAIKPGDEVAVKAGRGGMSIVKVLRLTPTQIIIDRNHTTKFSRKNGREIGNSSSWTPDEQLVELTFEVRNKIERAAQRQLNYSLIEAHFRNGNCKLTDSQLARMAAIVQEKQ